MWGVENGSLKRLAIGNRKNIEAWSGNGIHARHAKEQCYVMLGFSVKVRGYQKQN